MVQFSNSIRLFCVFVICAGCGQSSPPVNPPAVAGPSLSLATADPFLIPPHYSLVDIFINNEKSSDTNGCTATYSPKPTSAKSEYGSRLTCGHPGNVSQLSWSYLRSDESDDIYEFEYIFPFEGADQQIKKLEVKYNGKELVLFENDAQRIIMRPGRIIE